jgi:hypothetical protein
LVSYSLPEEGMTALVNRFGEAAAANDNQKSKRNGFH